jgi:hypothetical protein
MPGTRWVASRDEGQVNGLRTTQGMTLALLLAVALPVIVTLSGSYILARQTVKAQEGQSQQTKAEEIRTQSKLLLSNVWNEIEGVRIRATSYYEGGKKSVLNPQILTYSTIQWNESPLSKTQKITGFTKNSVWQNSSSSAELQSQMTRATSLLSLKQIQETGYGLVSVGGPVGNRLGVAFAASNQTGAPIIFVSVNPEEVFTSFGRWASRREAGNLRGYVIGSDGRVMIHSDRAYSGADFKTGELFKNALAPMFRGDRTSGVSTFISTDLRPVLTSYQRLGKLPYAVVVERVTRPATWQASLRPPLKQTLLLVVSVLVLCMISVLTIRNLIFNELARNENPFFDSVELELVLARQLKRLLKQEYTESGMAADPLESFNSDTPDTLQAHPLPPTTPRA